MTAISFDGVRLPRQFNDICASAGASIGPRSPCETTSPILCFKFYSRESNGHHRVFPGDHQFYHIAL